jgi:TPP-dependent 2-oxoacid decarboxylase
LQSLIVNLPDYELALLDLAEPAGLKWTGTPNELVGAYAADGYARQKGASALVATCGPGELSALCGIGGANCESVPIVHIVGYPTEAAQKSGNVLHYTLGDLKYECVLLYLYRRPLANSEPAISQDFLRAVLCNNSTA